MCLGTFGGRRMPLVEGMASWGPKELPDPVGPSPIPGMWFEGFYVLGKVFAPKILKLLKDMDY